jgi:hypothetical protein
LNNDTFFAIMKKDRGESGAGARLAVHKDSSDESDEVSCEWEKKK